MAINILTDLAVKNAKPGLKPYKMNDGAGLHLQITPSGGKLWRWSYEYANKAKLMSFGPYPFVTLAVAREEHKKAKALLATGVDPMKVRKEIKYGSKENDKPKKTTYGDVFKLWLAHWRQGKSSRYVKTVNTRIEKDILPVIGKMPIDEIKTTDIVNLIKMILERDAVDIAKRNLEKIKQLYRYAVAHGHVLLSPAAQILPSDILVSRPVQNFARIESPELPQLLKDIEIYCGNPLTRLAMKFMALTFVRTNEMLISEWSEIDFEGKRWNIPKEHMKGKKAPHIVPLSQQALEVLDLIRQVSGKSRWLFPGVGPKNPTMSNGTIDKALDRMGYQGRMTGHGFRGVASTILHESGYQHEHIDAQLAHSKRDKVSGAYDYAKYLEPREKLMLDWGNYMEKTLRTNKYALMKITLNVAE